MGKKLTQEEWINKANIVHNNFYNYDKVVYIKSRDKVIITCPIHGDFEQEANSHLQGQNCKICSREKLAKSNTLSNEEFLNRCKNTHGDKYDYSKVIYKKATEKVIIICPEHGEFLIKPFHHINGTGCKFCSGSKYSTKDWIKRAKEIHNNFYDYSKTEYLNKNEKVCIICPEHGEFWQTPSDHLRGYGCIKCINKSQTNLYNKLLESFVSKTILYEVSNINWLNKQRFDIYFPDYNIAIEYNGIQHYQPVEHFGGEEKFKIQKERDELKRQKCKDNNCTLFEVKYDYNDYDYENLVDNIKETIKGKNYEI